MKTTIRLTAAAIALFFLFTLNRIGVADESEGKAAAPFAGKVVTITVKDERFGTCLEKVEIRKLGSREFIVGTAVPADERFSVISGMTQWIALDAVLSIYEFKDLAEMKAAHERMHAAAK